MFCQNCGKEIGADSGFCPFCGAAVGAPAAGSGEGAGAPPPPPPPPEAPPSYEPGPAQPLAPGMPPMAPGPVGGAPGRSKLPWVIASVAAVAVIAAVVLVLVFVVFKGEGGGPDTQAIEKTVNTLFESIEKQDVDGILGVIEPKYLEELKDTLGKDYKSVIEEDWLAWFEGVEFDLRKLDVQINGDKAEANIVEGTVTYIDENGEKVTEEAGEGDEAPDAIKLVKVDGKWYVAKPSLTNLGLDPDLLGLGIDGEDGDLDGDLDGDTDGDFTGEVVLPVDNEDEVLMVLMEEPDIYDWVMAVDYPDYRITDEGDTYDVYLFEYDEDYNEVPFGRYVIEKESGEVTVVTE